MCMHSPIRARMSQLSPRITMRPVHMCSVIICCPVYLCCDITVHLCIHRHNSLRLCIFGPVHMCIHNTALSTCVSATLCISVSTTAYTFVSTYMYLSSHLDYQPGAITRSVAMSLGNQEALRSILASGTSFREDLVMKICLPPFFLFRWFKKSICQYDERMGAKYW